MKKVYYPIVTPTKWQLFLLRNYGLVNNAKLADVLSCSINTIKSEAQRLGISKIKYNKIWKEKSYLTIIRNNWHILPIKQLLILLDFSKSQLDFELKENDFLSVKLGKKPKCNSLKYKPLTKKEIIKTNKIKKIITSIFIDSYKPPFSFNYLSFDDSIENENINIVYPYIAPFGDKLLSTYKLISVNELKAMQNAGINGIWIQGLLSKLSKYPFSKYSNKDYLIRRNNLQKFINLAKKYNIGVYLYFNEPRSLKIKEIKDEYKYLVGRNENDEVSLCISQKEIQDYLYNATYDLVKNVKDIAGIITITSSENLTHCKHTLGSDCKKCESYKPYELASLINNIIHKAIIDTKANTKLIANLWGWAEYCGYSNDDIKNGIKLLNSNITIMCVSEFGTHKNKYIGEYSISNGEPCEETKLILKLAKENNHNIMAKIQINNSWELATIPYIPVFDLLINHIKKLKELGVKDVMSSWTLGGYPSISQYIVNSYLNNKDIEEIYDDLFKENNRETREIISTFSNAFKHFPFDINTLYFSPIHIAPINIVSKKISNLKATMVTYPFDDISSWTNNLESTINGLNKLLNEWEIGLIRLNKIKTDNKYIKEINIVAEALYLIYSSALNQFKYLGKYISYEEYKSIEKNIVIKFYKLCATNSFIGFEAANQYMLTQNMFLEKIISLIL